MDTALPAVIPPSIGLARLQQMRQEFRYFYPLDLRVSGKDLVPNHLTFFLYNHTAIFPSHQWPKAVRANGHLLLNSEKMSKSTGNFLTMRESLERYGADATRLALADAGDSIDDANFVEQLADVFILRLYAQLEFYQQIFSNTSTSTGNERTIQTRPASSPFNFHDKYFDAEMNHLIKATQASYQSMLYREALKNGFYEFQNARDRYRDAMASLAATNAGGLMHESLIFKFCQVQCILLAPFAPHFCDYLWRTFINGNGNGTAACASIMQAKWPKTLDQSAFEVSLAAGAYVHQLIKDARSAYNTHLNIIAKKANKKGAAATANANANASAKITVFIASSYPVWQTKCLEKLCQFWDEKSKSFDSKNLTPAIFADPECLSATAGNAARQKTMVMTFVKSMQKLVSDSGNSISALQSRKPCIFDEWTTVTENVDFIKRQLEISSLEIKRAEEVTAETPEIDRIISLALPEKPSFLVSL